MYFILVDLLNRLFILSFSWEINFTGLPEMKNLVDLQIFSIQNKLFCLNLYFVRAFSRLSPPRVIFL